jgi:HSP20 family protein
MPFGAGPAMSTGPHLTNLNAPPTCLPRLLSVEPRTRGLDPVQQRRLINPRSKTMNALTRLERFEDMFPEVFRRFARPLQWSEASPGEIKIDVTENDKEYLVRAEIPGAKKDDIRVTVDGNFVSISAEVRQEKEDKSDGGRVLLKETYYGSASRGFSLASEIDDKAVVAKLEDGVLKLTLPKRASAAAKAIAIQ